MLNYKAPFIVNKALMLIPIVLYIYGGRKVFLSKVLQQDDLKELSVESLQNLSCVWHEGDNHPLWSLIIWMVSRTGMPTQTVISLLNIFLAISSLLLIYYFLEKKYSKLYALLGSSILGNSFVFTYYSSNLKQYQIEILYSIIALVLHERFENRKKDYYQFIILATIFGLLSNATILVSLLFVLSFAIRSLEQNRNLFLYFIFLSIPGFLVVNDKISRETFQSYWDEFFINTDSFQEFISSMYFLFSLFIKGLFGDSLWRIGLLIFFFSLVYSLIKRQTMFATIVIFSLVACSILKLYPLGAGRSDVMFYPFVLLLIISFINEIKITNDYLKVVPLFILVVFSTFIDSEPAYKKENINEAVYQIFNQNKDSVVLVSDEQYVGFTYYSKDIFGETVDDSDPRCGKKVVNNDRIYHLREGYSESYLKEMNLPSGVNIWVVGIELEGTNGRFRLAEDFLIKENYRKISEYQFDIGVYAIEYKK